MIETLFVRLVYTIGLHEQISQLFAKKCRRIFGIYSIVFASWMKNYISVANIVNNYGQILK